MPAPIVLALALGCLWVGNRSCAVDSGPQLVRVLEVVPHEVEVGDRLAILGDGFPPGKPARVTFKGTLRRPGERPVRGSEIAVPATVVASNRIDLAFDDATQARFCLSGDGTVHTAFEGVVEVAFAAAAPGAPPIAGSLEHVAIDVRPSASSSLRRRESEGERVLELIGVRAVGGPSGLVVETVNAGSRAQAAGIAPGDVLTSFDGVRIGSPADVVPPPGEHSATIGVRSTSDGLQAPGARRDPDGERGETMRIVAMDGFVGAFPADLVGASLIVLAALAIVSLFAAPVRPAVAAALHRSVSRMRQRLGVRGLLPGLSVVVADSLPPFGPPAIVDAVACTLLAAMPFGQYVVAAHLDVGLLFVAAVTCIAAAAFVAGRSAWLGLRAALHVAWQHAPAAAALASVVVTTGSVRIQEIERAQGGWPWQWLAFRSPAGPVALALLLACGRIEPRATFVATNPATTQRRRGLASLLEDPSGEASGRPMPWLEAACRGHRIVVAGLASALFLGGWLLPEVSAVEQRAHPALELAGALLLLAKAGFVVGVLAWSRWVLPRWRMQQSTRATALWMGPLAMASLAATATWTWWGPPPAVQVLVSSSLVVVVGLGAAAIAHRVRCGLMPAVTDAHLSPFL